MLFTRPKFARQEEVRCPHVVANRMAPRRGARPCAQVRGRQVVPVRLVGMRDLAQPVLDSPDSYRSGRQLVMPLYGAWSTTCSRDQAALDHARQRLMMGGCNRVRVTVVDPTRAQHTCDMQHISRITLTSVFPTHSVGITRVWHTSHCRPRVLVQGRTASHAADLVRAACQCARQYGSNICT
jgi:hypothetical protein